TYLAHPLPVPLRSPWQMGLIHGRRGHFCPPRPPRRGANPWKVAIDGRRERCNSSIDPALYQPSKEHPMKVIARLALFGVTALLATPATAPGQTQGPPPGQRDGEFPYAPPPSFDPSGLAQPPAENDQQGPVVGEVPDVIPPSADVTPEPTPDLTTDDAIADSYDDGYDPQA